MSMRMLLAATLAAGFAVVVASPATADDPPPTLPSDAAIAQYSEAVPSATGPVPVGRPARTAHAAALPLAVRTHVERTAGADAPALLHIAQDSRFGAPPVARPAARPKTAQAGSETAARPTSARPIRTPEPLAAAVSTAGSHGLLLVALLLIAITAASIAARVLRR